MDGVVDVGISAPKSVPVDRMEAFNRNKEKRIKHECK